MNRSITFCLFFLVGLMGTVTSCSSDAGKKAPSSYAKGSYGYDRDFLNQHAKNFIELANREGARVLVSADWQGRVMTSTAAGDSGKSFGWINYDLISSGVRKKQFNPIGGEERFWLGPEGGQYSLYFKKGDSFNIAHWQVPPVVDTDTYKMSRLDATKAAFSKTALLTNYGGTHFSIAINRTIQLLSRASLMYELQVQLPSSVHVVGYQSDNTITNTGTQNWKKENGLISIWLLGMMSPTPQTKVIMPFNPVPDPKAFITDDYFGKIPPGRLAVKDHVLYLRCDGKARGKVGIAPAIAKSPVGSYDFENNVLTLISFPVDKRGDYVNSKWEWQQQPYRGDAVNAYNDGPLKDGSQLGPFYEIESSSPVKELKKGESIHYRQITCHIQGSYAALKLLAKQLLDVDLDELKKW
jgi:hypothetical protein